MNNACIRVHMLVHVSAHKRALEHVAGTTTRFMNNPYEESDAKGSGAASGNVNAFYCRAPIGMIEQVVNVFCIMLILRA